MYTLEGLNDKQILLGLPLLSPICYHHTCCWNTSISFLSSFESLYRTLKHFLPLLSLVKYVYDLLCSL